MQDDDASGWWVICLCAGWCGVCRDWRASFAAAARADTSCSYAWVDVEDEADSMGDLEIETFPTLLIARGERALFLGPVQPSAQQLARLIDALKAQAHPRAGIDESHHALLKRLQVHVLPSSAL